MRILGFSKKWNKLQEPVFTTFRFKRKGKDWQLGEVVKVVYHPRNKDHQLLGTAQIIGKEPRAMAWLSDRTGRIPITNEEAVLDGFEDTTRDLAYFEMWKFLYDNYGFERLCSEPMNKITLRWVSSVTDSKVEKKEG